MSENKLTALVTGASAGLGVAFCRQLAERCNVIIAVARRGERLEALAQELAEKVEMHVVEADLLTVEGVTQTVETLRQKGPVNILVNKGDQVIKGQTLLVLEAMKIQQQIKSDVDGIVDDVLGQQGQQVKKRQMLFTIQT